MKTGIAVTIVAILSLASILVFGHQKMNDSNTKVFDRVNDKHQTQPKN